MPATQPEINDAFSRIANSLREANLVWLLDEVLDQINQGKSEITRVKELREDRHTGDRALLTEELFKVGQLREYRRTVEYTAEERIGLLLTAIEELFVTIPEMQDSVSKHFPEARFVAGNETLTVLPRTTAQVGSTEKLRQLIRDLRREVLA